MKEVVSRQFNVGLDTDSNPKFSPEGTYRFALNSTLETTDGGIPTITNEVGTAVSALLEDGYKPIGACLTNTSDIVIFATNEVTSQIGLFNPDKHSYTVLIESSCLGLTTKYPVSSLFNIRKGCERMVYFTDRFNKYRAINLDGLESYTSEATVDLANANDNWNCDEFSLTPNYDVPIMDLIDVEEGGGSLKVGTYQFTIQYIDEDGNESPWFNVTTPVPIMTGNSHGDYRNIHGGLAVANTAEAEEGSVPTTSKAIRLNITNLDTDYPYFRVAALHSTGNIGRVTEVWNLEATSITGTEQQFVYRGVNSSTDTQGSLANINIDNAPIHVAKAHAQIDQALWLANLEGVKYNYADFQRAASLISTTPAINQTQVTDAQNPGDPKCPDTWWNTRSFMPDEVYAFGIQYLYKDGSWSPVFHIPGRAATTSDLAESNTIESSFLGTGNFPEWRINNTGSETQFAYHETLTNTYPDIEDCSGESIWGIDSEGTQLAGTKIRHHRFPSRREIPVYDQTTDSINVLGIRFDNITYPHADIVGHRFMMAERTEGNKTVIDNGFVWPTNDTLNSGTITYAGQQPGITDQYDTFAFHSPKTLVEQRFMNATHYDFHTKISSFPNANSSNDDIDIKGAAAPAGIFLYGVNAGAGSYDPGDSVPQRIAIDTSIFVAPRSSQNEFGSFPTSLVNASHLNTSYFVHTQQPFDFTSSFNHIAAAKRNIDPYTSLSNTVYYSIQPDYFTDTNAVEVYGGDSFITAMRYVDTAFVNALDPSAKHLKTVVGDYWTGVWVDSEINYYLIHGGADRCNTVFDGIGPVWEHVRDKLTDVDPDTINPITGQPSVDTKYVTRESFCTEYYAYNKDYSKVILEKPGVSLSYRFDYCSECLNSFPNRIRVSQKNYQESSLDNFRIFRDGDRNDLPGTSGDVNALLVLNDNLYALCDRDIYMVPINPQTIQTSESLAYLGTGARLAIPPRRLSSTQYSYGGSKHLFSTMVTEFGAVYTDSASKKVIMLTTEGMKDISANGMRKFFQNNMEFKLDQQFQQQLGIEYPFQDHTTYEYGLGFIVAYDPEQKRLILSKKDYRLRDDVVSKLGNTYNDGDINWINDKFYINKRQQSVQLDFSDARYFENRSWTISYNLPRQRWASYHSYLPTLLFNDPTSFYSVIDSNTIWRHGREADFQKYYGTKKDHVVDFTAASNPTLAATYDVFDVNSNFTAEADTDNYFFDAAILYNSYQSTGLQNISIRSNTFDSGIETSLIATKAERNWRFNNFRDLVTDYTVPLFSDNWSDISGEYYIDKVPNSDAFSGTKSEFEKARLRDHYVGCRLFFKPEENIKVTTDIISSINKISFR